MSIWQRFRLYFRRFRWYMRWILVYLLLLIFLTSDSVLPPQTLNLTLGSLLGDQRFDWVALAWDTWTDQLQPLQGGVGGGPPSLDQRSDFVEAYLARQGDIQVLERQLEEAYAQMPANEMAAVPFGKRHATPSPQIQGLTNDLTALQAQQAEETSLVEKILAAQVSQVLLDAGFGDDELWPPLIFRFVDLPTLFILSPRDHIEMFRARYVTPGMPADERTILEATAEAEFDLSALVDNVGGIGFWPALVTNRASLRSRLNIIAHEWTHNYLIFYPLGQGYFANRDMTTINESVASIMGEEVAELVMTRYYAHLLPPPTPTSNPAQPTLTPAPTATLDPNAPETFAQAMRRIRLKVDDLLAADKVEEAEAFMEEERQKLVARGYRLRKLNQAYFAFHGHYATNATSVNPIGPWLRQLRQDSGSLKAFMDRVSIFTSLDDLLAQLEEK